MPNFLCISNYNNDVDWLKSYPNDYIIYDRSDNNANIIYNTKVIKTPNVGYNIYDMFTFIIDNYNNLPNYTTFIKANIVPRHLTKNRFELLMNNKFFTPLFEPELHNPYMPICMFSSDGVWSELNQMSTSPDLARHPVKYFQTYNELMSLFFENPIIPKYISFAPGANYVIPKEMIYKYPLEFYQQLREFISYDKLPWEAHIIERALYSIWLCNFKLKQI